MTDIDEIGDNATRSERAWSLEPSAFKACAVSVETARYNEQIGEKLARAAPPFSMEEAMAATD